MGQLWTNDRDSERKPVETSLNVSQREMPFLGVVSAPKPVASELLDRCSNARQALSLCIRMSGFTDEVVAEKVGITKGYLSKILNGRASLDGDRRMKLMEVCGNCAPTQYEARRLGFELVERSKDARIQQLEALIQTLKAA